MIAKRHESPARTDKDYLKAMSAQQRKDWAKGIVMRMMKVWKLDEMQDISTIIGGHSRTASNWVQTGAVPFDAIYTCHMQTNASLDWLYHGKSPTTTLPDGSMLRIQEKAVKLLYSLELGGLITAGDGANTTHAFKGVANAVTKTIVDEILVIQSENQQ